MKIDIVKNFIQEFTESSQFQLSPIKCEYSDLLDMSRFHEESKKIEGYQGVYLIQSNETGDILYVGKSTNIANRLYSHIGSKYSWNRDNSTCNFPNFVLTKWEGHEKYRDICQSGNISVTAINITPPEAMSLIESAIIYYGFTKNDKPALNISF